MSGYPPGTSDQLPGYSGHGALHDLFSAARFRGLGGGLLRVGRRFTSRGEHGWATYSTISGAVLAGGFLLASAGFGQAEGLVDLAGLFQRVAVGVGFGWLALLAVRLLKGEA